MFAGYAVAGLLVWCLYRAPVGDGVAAASERPAALGPSRGIVLRLALLFSVDSFAGGLRAVVTPPERAAAASATAVPRSLAAALSPALAGALFSAGWLAAPLV